MTKATPKGRAAAAATTPASNMNNTKKKAKSVNSATAAGKKKPDSSTTAAATAAASAGPSLPPVQPVLPLLKSFADVVSGRVLKSPSQVQQLLNECKYNTDPVVRCPAEAFAARKAHCLDGAGLAAAAMRGLGYPARIAFLNAVEDDGHALCIFKSKDGKRFGAVAKSNFVGLRYREPVYKSMRELVMSYFENYYNLEGKRGLRGFTNPVSLDRFDRLNWTTDNAAMDKIEQALYDAHEFELITKAQARGLGLVDDRSYRAGMVGTDLAGVHGSDKKK